METSTSTNGVENTKQRAETMNNRTVLIDADISAFQVASTKEEVFEFNGRHVLHADLDDGIAELDNLIEWIIETTGSGSAALFLTGTDNFRKLVLPTYKAQRTQRKPMILSGLREHLRTHPRCFLEDTLEGDDLIGIHATRPHKGERVIYSADKDLKTIPGLHWCPEDGEVIEIGQKAADDFFFEQILTGDAVDNYAGCPGVGPVAAKEMIENPFKWVRETRVIKAGKNKGQEKVEWKKEPVEVHNYIDIWSCIVSAYEKAGLNERDALQQARCARILRDGEYDFEKGKVNLWTPE